MSGFNFFEFTQERERRNGGLHYSSRIEILALPRRTTDRLFPIEVAIVGNLNIGQRRDLGQGRAQCRLTISHVRAESKQAGGHVKVNR
jgi:hypothetical protein